MNISQHSCQSIKTVWTKKLSGNIFVRTRQVFNGPRTSNLSQQQQQQNLVEMIFGQQNQRNFPERKFFSEKNLRKINLGKKFFWKKIRKNFF